MLFLYMEGLLEREERRQVEDYVAAHSEAQELMQLYDPGLTLPKELPLADREGRPLHYPDKDSLYSHAMAAAHEPGHKQETPVVPLHTSRATSLRRTLTAAACAAAVLILGIEVVLHVGIPAIDNGPAIATLRHDMQQQGSTQALAGAIAKADEMQSSRQETPQQPLARTDASSRTARADHNIEELQAIAATLHSARRAPDMPATDEILLGETLYAEGSHALPNEYPGEMLQQNLLASADEVITVNNLVLYTDSLSPAERVWDHVLSSNPQLASLSKQWESRAQNGERSAEQTEGNILQRIAHRLGWERKTNIKTEFNNLGQYLAQVDNLKQNSMKWIADGADTLGQRFTNFAKNTLQDERFSARRTPQTTPSNE